MINRVNPALSRQLGVRAYQGGGEKKGWRVQASMYMVRNSGPETDVTDTSSFSLLIAFLVEIREG